tara:strand:+ start:512 stop:1660 length:1149 start_codon:yes stop_codon:yes gene_type:complete
MSSPGFSSVDDPKLIEAEEAFAKYDTQRDAAEALGIARSTLRNRVKALEALREIPRGQRDAILHSGLSVGTAKAGWRKIKNDDGTSDSVYWRAESDIEETPENIAERIAEKMEKIRPAPAIKRIVQTTRELRNFVPVFDVHLSMRVGDYGTADAIDRLRHGIDDVVDRLPAAECTIILNGGDFSHQDDPSNLTPQSKHPLPVDMEYDDTTDAAVEITVEMIEKALTRSETVIYKALRGNHDPNTARILRAALKQRYRKDDRVIIDSDGIEFFMHEWGQNFIGGHHGDLRKKPADLVLGFANKYAGAWGRTTCRDLWNGHLHHDLVQDFTGMRKIQVRAICPADRHSNENLYDSPSEMVGVSYRESGGWHDKIIHGFPLLEKD